MKRLWGGSTRICANHYKQAVAEYSKYLRLETEDEMSGVLPQSNLLLGVFAQMGKSQFRAAEFSDKLDYYMSFMGAKRVNPYEVLDTFFKFNVVGNLGRRQRPVFYYESSNLRLDTSESLAIHRGLQSALHVI